MSYRRGWLLLQEIEEVMGASAVVGKSGGARGGGTSLTPLGRAVLKQYRDIELRAERATRDPLRSLARLAKARGHRSGAAPA
jgi:molybdate transport system regulatory protein